MPASSKRQSWPKQLSRWKCADTRALEQSLSNALGLEVTINDKNGAGDVKVAYKTLDQLDEIIRRLRAFVARGEVARRPESVAKLIEEASALALVGVKELGIKVLITIDPDLPNAMVDRVQVQQVLLNLIRNAVEAMEGQELRELSVGTVVENGVVLVSVADTGGGISPAIEAKLFTLINDARVSHGLVPLRGWSKLTTLAGDRAAYMAKMKKFLAPLTTLAGQVGGMPPAPAPQLTSFQRDTILKWESEAADGGNHASHQGGDQRRLRLHGGVGR